MTEAEWQQQFIDLAHFYRWKHMFVRRSVGRGRRWTTATNVPGWPDLFLWNEAQRRTMHVELKSEGGVLSDDQRRVLQSLEAAGQEVHVFKPDDLTDARLVLAPQDGQR